MTLENLLWVLVGTFCAFVFVYVSYKLQTYTHDTTYDNKREQFTAGISMQNTTNLRFPLIDYTVKASAHTAYESVSNTVTLAQIRTVIKRGCRWLDFDIFSIDHLPVIGFSTSASIKPGQGVDSSNTLPFTQTMEEIQRTAFSATTCPNSSDPLFINIRIKTSDTDTFSVIQAAVVNAFGTRLYTNKIDPKKTILSVLSKKVVLVVDTLFSAPELSTKCDNSIPSCAAVKSVTNIAGMLCGNATCPVTLQSGQLKMAPSPIMPGNMETMQTMRMGYHLNDNSDIIDHFEVIGKPNDKTNKKTTKIKSSTKKNETTRDTTATQFRCSIPDFESSKTSANPSIVSFLRDHGVQVVPFRFYRDDEGLAEYEQLFNDHGHSAFLALATAVKVAATI